MTENSRRSELEDGAFDSVKPGLEIRALGEHGASITRHVLANQTMATIIISEEGNFVLQSDGNGPGLVLLLPTLKFQPPGLSDVKVTRVLIVRRTKRAAIGEVIG